MLPGGPIRKFRLEPPGTLLGEEQLRRLGRTCIKEVDGKFTWRFDWRAFGLGYPPVWPDLPKITMPTLVVRGEHSIVMPRPEFEKVLAGLPDAKGVEIPRAHHHVPLDAPEETARHLVEFLLA